MNTLIIEALDCIPSLDGKTNVVSCIHWRANGTDGTNNVTTYGSEALEYDSEEKYLSYENLTEEQIIAWLKDSMKDRFFDIENVINGLLNELASPSTITPELPWNIKTKGK
jgi:hypothetical protein